jgi:hypothetical protein
VETLTPYIFKREADRCVFLPSPAFSRVSVGMFAGGSLLMLYLSSIFFRDLGAAPARFWIGAIFVAVACYSATLAARSWSERNTPLSIEAGGRVRYGQRELCAAGTVHAVRLIGARGGERNECEIALELVDGTKVHLPSQYFGIYRPRLHARPFAAKLAQELKVPVTESA